jgi:hypothetical protein
MKTVRNIVWVIVTATLLVTITCQGQIVRLTKLDTSYGRLDFTLAPSDAVFDYSCSVEWRSTLSTGAWTNSWYQPFVPFPQTNGMFYAALPRFFRIRCAAGQTTSPPPISYTVTGIIPSHIINGDILWPNSGGTNLIYYVEQAISTNGPWLSQWASQMNIHTTTAVTNVFTVPMFFRVVTVAESGELPW